MFASEKEGGNARSNSMMQAFRDCLLDCGLEDLGYKGDCFTWQRGEIRERLDRLVANQAWLQKFPLSAVTNAEHVHSDHRPLILDTEYEEAIRFVSPAGVRHFEARWVQEETVNEIVKSAWDRAKAAGIGPSLADRTKAVHADLHDWDRNVLKSPKKRIRKLKKELEKLRLGPNTLESRARLREVQVLLENLMDQEELYWIQRGRANWLLHGDRNTSYFHNAATTRKKRNQIKKLLDESGVYGSAQISCHFLLR